MTALPLTPAQAAAFVRALEALAGSGHGRVTVQFGDLKALTEPGWPIYVIQTKGGSGTPESYPTLADFRAAYGLEGE